MNGKTFNFEDRSRCAADADSVDAHAQVCRQLRRKNWIRILVVLPIAEQDDHSRCVPALRRRCRRLKRCEAVGAQDGRVSGINGDRIERNQNTVSDRRTAARDETLYRSQSLFPVSRRSLYRYTAVTESDNCNQYTGRLVPYKLARRGFGCFHARWLQVIRCHTA